MVPKLHDSCSEIDCAVHPFLDLEEATNFIKSEAHADANIIFGAAIDDSMKEKFQITVIATGFNNEKPMLQEVTMDKNTSDIMAADDSMDLDIVQPEPETQKANVVKIGTIISEFTDDGEYDIPTFVRLQKSV